MQWGIGYAGTEAVRSITRHPNLKLVGAWVHSESKAGVDVGELAGVGPLGVITTTDTEALLALRPDCVVYTAQSLGRNEGVVEDLARLLRNGINVVNLSLPALFYPEYADPRFFDVLESAARLGGSSLYTSGIDPGLGNAGLVLHGLSLCTDVRQVTMQQVLNIATFDNPDTLFDTLGFGQPDLSTARLLQPGVLTATWGPLLAMVAEALGVRLDSIEESYEAAYSDRSFFVAAGVIDAEAVAGVRFSVTGYHDGEPLVAYERVNRLRDSDAPHWPHGDGFRVDIDADPHIHLELAMSGEAWRNAPVIAAVNHLLSAIPMVVAAPPGIMTMLDVATGSSLRGARAT
ncbi:MAG: diacylglycerol kinase [Actinobacteria bacterium]|nr:diacylglycerol kinase [Actinomycetota bacterium]